MSEERRMPLEVRASRLGCGRGGGREKRREERSSLPVGELRALDIAQLPGLPPLPVVDGGRCGSGIAVTTLLPVLHVRKDLVSPNWPKRSTSEVARDAVVACLEDNYDNAAESNNLTSGHPLLQLT